MAKISKSVSFKNAVINVDEDTIIELTKDDEKLYRLSDILRSWDGVENISFSIKQDNEMPTLDE